MADIGDLRAIFEPLGIEFVQCKSGTEWSDSHIPQAIKAGKFDTIIIATPPQFHMETLQNIARVVARARKKITIYVEKPIDVSVSRVLAALPAVQMLESRGHCVQAIDHYRYKWVTLWLHSQRNQWDIGCLERAYFVSYEPQEMASSEAFRFGYLIEHGSRSLSVLQAMSKKWINIIGSSIKTDEPILGFQHLRCPAECERDTAAMVTLTVHAKEKEKCESFEFPFTIAVGKGMGEKWKGKWVRLDGTDGTVWADINSNKVYFRKKYRSTCKFDLSKADTYKPEACEPTQAYDVLLRMMLCLDVPCFDKQQDVPHFLSVEEAMGFLQPIQNASDTLKANEAYSRYDPGNPAVEMQDILNKVLDDLPEDS